MVMAFEMGEEQEIDPDGSADGDGWNFPVSTKKRLAVAT